MGELVTGDAVVVELRTAQVPSRALAFALDLLVMAAALTVLALVATRALAEVDQALAAAIALVVVLSVFVGYPVLVETLTRGRSLGKAALGLRVVRLDGGPIRFRQALARALAGFIVDFGLLSGFTGVIAILTSLASPQGRRVGDLLAGTVVVRERVPATASTASTTPAVAMPPPLAGWAAGLELSRLPDGLALEARQFLLRAERLDPRARVPLAADLASRVSAAVAPAAPPGTPAEPFLAAVLAERRRRESARLAGQHASHAHPPPHAVPVPPARPTGPPGPGPVLPATGPGAPPPDPVGFAPPS